MNREPLLELTWLNGDLEDEIQCASQTDHRVMITGESGVGKRFAADMIHRWSSRRRHPFVPINGSDVDPRHLQVAHHGTLFIQDIENVPDPGQSQLLQLVEDADMHDVRLMTATSVHLVDRVHAGVFRDDLFYRLNVIHLVIPPLRERPEDIPAMFNFYLALHARAGTPELSSATRRRLVEYAWPGNVRELKTVTQQLCAQDLPKLIEPEHLPCPIGG
jgi:DNA-binding NtrC family response regulator